MRLFFKSVIAPFVITLFFGSLIIVFLYIDYKKERDLFINYQIENTEQTYNAVFLGFETTTNAIFASLKQNKIIFDMIGNGLNNPDNNLTRQKIYNALLEEYNSLSGLGLKQLHFHTKDGKSYLRMHKPEDFGDYLFGIRPTIKVANEGQKYISGFEEGRVYNGFRYIHPIFYKNNFMGTVETSINAGTILEHIAKINNTPYRIFFDKNMVLTSVKNDYVDKYYKQSKLSPNLVLEKIYDQNTPVLSKINELLAPRIQNKLDNFDTFIEAITLDEQDYIVTFFPIKNFSGKKVAYLVSYSKNEFLSKLDRDFRNKIILLIVILSTMFWFMVRLSVENQRRTTVENDLKELNKKLEEKVLEKLSELRFKDEALLRQSKNALMGEMISVIAHQWKQPVQAVMLLAQDLELGAELDSLNKAEIIESSAMLMQQAKYMSETIDNFRYFFKNNSPSLEFVSKIVNDAKNLIAKNLDISKIEVDIVGDDFQIETIPSDLKQLFLNIINNAKDQIVAKNCDNKTIVVKLDSKSKSIEICDFAGGIPDDIVNSIFEPYFTTKGERGTGIGLYMVKMIAEDKLGIKIEAFNRDGGAVFKITF